MKEMWKDIKGYEGLYQVSNLGRIKSIIRKFAYGLYNKICKMTKEGLSQNNIGKILNISQAQVSRVFNKINKCEETILKPDKKKISGYLRVTLCKNGKTKRFQIHRLVLEAFIGPRPSEDHYGMHEDNNPENNIYINLKWGTSQENSDHRTTSGHNVGANLGSKHHYAKAKEKQIPEIRKMLFLNIPVSIIAKKFDLSTGIIYHIKDGSCWGHVK